jgi:hypothetical protein
MVLTTSRWQHVMGGRSTAARAAALAAVTSIAVATIGLVVQPIWTFPDTATSAAALTRFVDDHRTRLQLMTAMYTIAVSLWLVFGLAVWAHLRPSAKGAGRLAGACFAGGVIGFVTLLLAGFTVFDVLVLRGPHLTDPKLLYDLAFGLLAMSGLPTAVALGSFVVMARGTGTVPRQISRLAVLAAAFHGALLISFFVPRGPFALEGQANITGIPALLWAWILATGVALWRAPAPRPAR